MASVRIRERGQITIPNGLRQELNLKPDSLVTLVKIGRSILIIPKQLEGDALAASYAKSAQRHSVSLESLIKDLKKERKAYYREHYGS